jgi:RNA polymerase sigma-70 factor (ECF subfamily)
VFRSVWDETGRIDQARSAFGGWLLAAVQHRAVDVVRREDNRRRRPSPADALALFDPSSTADDDEVPWWGLRRDRVQAALAQLPREDRDVLVLAYFGGYTQREIAGITGVPFATVKARMLSAVRGLREGLGDEAMVTP